MAIEEKIGIFTQVDDEGNEIQLYPVVKTDSTLSTEGTPADAAATGEEIAATNAELNTKLPLSGGTMTGDLTSQNIYPETSSASTCGSTLKPFASTNSNKFYAVGTDAGIYAQLLSSRAGTTSTVGLGDLWLGNNVASGTAKNAKGRIILCNSGIGYSVIQDNDSTNTNRTLTLPKVSGTIPVVSVSGTTLNINF